MSCLTGYPPKCVCTLRFYLKIEIYRNKTYEFKFNSILLQIVIQKCTSTVISTLNFNLCLTQSQNLTHKLKIISHVKSFFLCIITLVPKSIIPFKSFKVLKFQRLIKVQFACQFSQVNALPTKHAFCIMVIDGKKK